MNPRNDHYYDLPDEPDPEVTDEELANLDQIIETACLFEKQIKPDDAITIRAALRTMADNWLLHAIEYERMLNEKVGL